MKRRLRRDFEQFRSRDFPARDQWFAIFVAFQTQLWDTDDQGNPAPGRLEARAAPEVPT